MMHILIADDHAMVRRGLREILADELPDARFSEGEDGNEVLSQLATSDYDMLLLDINMPGRNGLDVLKDVRGTYPLLPVIMISGQPEELYAKRCLNAGAAAYINKDYVSERLAQETRKILSREIARHISEEG